MANTEYMETGGRAGLWFMVFALLLFAFHRDVYAEPRPISLELLVYGGSGKVGTYIVSEALERGHTVTAVSRDPAGITLSHERLTVVRGDLLDSGRVAELVKGMDTVVTSVRGVVGDSEDPTQTVVRLGVESVVTALRALGPGAARLIHVGGAGTLEVEPGVLLADRLPALFMSKTLKTEIAGQALVLDYLRGVHDVNWTYITPPKTLNGRKRTGVYRIGGDRMLRDDKGRSILSRADFAVALIDEAERGAFLQQRFSVAY